MSPFTRWQDISYRVGYQLGCRFPGVTNKKILDKCAIYLKKGVMVDRKCALYHDRRDNKMLTYQHVRRARRNMKATALYSAVWDFDQWLRNKIKYEDKEELQPIRDKLWEFLDESGISFDGEFS